MINTEVSTSTENKPHWHEPLKKRVAEIAGPDAEPGLVALETRRAIGVVADVSQLDNSPLPLEDEAYRSFYNSPEAKIRFLWGGQDCSVEELEERMTLIQVGKQVPPALESISILSAPDTANPAQTLEPNAVREYIETIYHPHACAIADALWEQQTAQRLLQHEDPAATITVSKSDKAA